ncbi:protein-export chaperone SecB [Geobacter sulfurreducens]|uniref:protein-export chaperone SecB n=1 Tax=Geobacter sulfurreducens TaxID=35554 RepID=UPI0009E6335F|nr:protein-export chaperone SecB [Geobacter sulfurreducens]QVW34414.1 protein-export chaperone SecB [Geobacter sulfurreducens]
MEKRYGEFINSLELLDIYLGSAQFKRHAFPDPETFPEVKVNFSAGKSDYKKSEDELYVDQEVRFLLEDVSVDRKKSRKLFELKGVFTLIYHSSVEMDDELFDLFKKRNIPVNLHPYVRELIHNSMTRAGLPSFVLPTLKIKR